MRFRQISKVVVLRSRFNNEELSSLVISGVRERGNNESPTIFAITLLTDLTNCEHIAVLIAKYYTSLRDLHQVRSRSSVNTAVKLLPGLQD